MKANKFGNFFCERERYVALKRSIVIPIWYSVYVKKCFCIPYYAFWLQAINGYVNMKLQRNLVVTKVGFILKTLAVLQCWAVSCGVSTHTQRHRSANIATYLLIYRNRSCRAFIDDVSMKCSWSLTFFNSLRAAALGVASCYKSVGQTLMTSNTTMLLREGSEKQLALWVWISLKQRCNLFIATIWLSSIRYLRSTRTI